MDQHDQDKSRDQLSAELAQARQQIAVLETANAEYRRSGQRALELAVEEIRIAALKNFLNNLSGFIKTPLQVIQASIFVLRDRPVEEIRQEQWQVLETQTQYLEQLVDNMLLMVRLDQLEELELKAINLNRVVQLVYDRLKPLAAQREHTLAYHTDMDPLPVHADDTLLKKALMAVITNALDFTPPGGIITLETYLQAQTAVIAVRDNGIGIDPEDLPYIFKRFWWANRADYPNPSSVGLGLALARRIIELHTGRIDVESIREEGSMFWLRLPIKNSKILFPKD